MAWKKSTSQFMDFFRRQLAGVDALPQLALLALITGLLTGAVVLGFRVAIEYSLGNWLLPGGDAEAFEQLDIYTRFSTAVLGAGIIGLLLNRLNASERRVGVVHVMERLSRHQGHLPLKNFLVQFFGGIIGLISGQSGGREGPAIHLGAACASLLGQKFELPNNSIRTLIACGTASAIACSFNTPMAGVIFAMEVVMMEYTLTSFIPVIVSAVTSTLLTHTFIGDDPAFTVAPLDMQSLLEIPYIVFAGLLIGCLAAGYIKLIQLFATLNDQPFLLRCLLAGIITGGISIGVPQVMGIGYDTLGAAMLGQLGMMTLVLIVLGKMLTSAAATGLGLPVGLIGPSLLIGACVGALIGQLGSLTNPADMSSDGFYVMLGMSAMMAAVLQAPLAALVSVLELTANPNVILPAMLIIVVATMITSEVFGSKGVFLRTLNTLGLQYPPSPVTQHMQRVGVTSVMERSIARLPPEVDAESARKALARKPRWILVETEPGEIRCVLHAPDLQAFLDDLPARFLPQVIATAMQDPSESDEQLVDEVAPEPEPAPLISLLRLPGMRKDVTNVDARVTLLEAQAALNSSGAEAVCVRRTSAPLIAPILGVVTKEQIDSYREVN